MWLSQSKGKNFMPSLHQNKSNTERERVMRGGKMRMGVALILLLSPLLQLFTISTQNTHLLLFKLRQRIKEYFCGPKYPQSPISHSKFFKPIFYFVGWICNLEN